MRFLMQSRSLANLAGNLKSIPKNKVVRVRFAPSPTGYLHLGGLRTALYNLFLARQHGGQFVLRIEDTDQTRVVPGALEQMERDLMWAGVVPDEGPSAGGSYGPYIQSQRTHLYRTQAQVLVDKNAAYPCFCTEKRLELLRREALRLGETPKYDNKCRDLSKEEAQAKVDAGQPHCIRFKLSPLNEPVADLVCNSLAYEPCEHEGDPVIMKQDKFPTYHLANVVDDHMMVITHVLRGVEWQISTPKHILMYKAFGWDAPKYAHLPLINNSDGSKLSKRQDDVRVESYRNKGVFPLALVNFVTKAGGGFKNFDLDTIYSIDQLTEKFDLDLVHKNSCKMTDRLGEYNRSVLQAMLSSDENIIKLVSTVVGKVQSTYKDKCLDLDREHVKNILIWSQDRINYLEDLVEPKMAYLWVVPSDDVLLSAKLNLDHIDLVLKFVSSKVEFEKEFLKSSLRQFAEEKNISFSKLMKMLRSALSGLKEGPPVTELMEILGRDSVISRLQRTISVLEKCPAVSSVGK